MLGRVPPQSGGEADGPRLLAQDLDHGRQGVGAVVVAGPAGEGEPAGHGQRAVRIVVGEPQLVGGDLHGGREAGVEVEVVDPVDGGAGQGECGGPGEADGR